MLPAIQLLRCYQGESFSKTATCRDADGLANLTGYTASFLVKNADGTTIATPTLTLGGSAGTVVIELSSAATEALPPGTYRYDFSVTSSGGLKFPLMTGSFDIIGRV